MPGAATCRGLFEGRSSRIYDVVARRVLRGMYRRLAADVAEVAPEGGAVLDIGTGPGVLLVELAARRPDLRLTGVDLSADMIAAAKRNLEPFGDRASARVGDVTSLPFPDRSFDLIVSSLSLHHWDDPEAAVPELARVLRPGGRLLHLRLPVRTVRHARRRRPYPICPQWRVAAAYPIRTGVPFLRCVRYVMSS